MSYLRSNKAQLATIVVLAGLLVTLALFQYNWLGQLSERERARMEINLRFATRSVRFEFDGELAELYRTFQVDFREPESFPEQLASRYGERASALDGPDVLERLYWVTHDEESGLVIREFTGTDHLVRLDTWPPRLAHLEPDFADALKYNDVQFDLVVGPPPLQDDIPALVIQQVLTRPRQSLPERRSISWVIAVLSRAAIFEELLPQLSEEYISGEEAIDYNVGIIDNDDPVSLVYVSGPGLDVASFEAPDAEGGIYGLRSFQFDARSVINRRAWEVIEESSEPRWRLVVKHHAGSLEAAVAAARNRSLAMSLGVLLLLGVSVGMIVVSTRRAQRLAEQQMEFVAGVSHELRTPLAVIRAAGENLADDVVLDPERTRQYGELIDREGRRLSDMVERVLLFAKIRSGHEQYEIGAVDPAALIADAVESNQVLAHEQGVALEAEVSESLPVLQGDETALKSALQNLISNALKYSQRGGVVSIEARSAKDETGPQIQIGIRDHGEGIPASEIAHVFEPFFRGRRARRAQIQGSGLGLSLVKRIIDAHGGSVTVESAPGKGSTFLVRLPLDSDGAARRPGGRPG